MGEVDGAIERIDNPCWSIGDEVLFGAAFTVCFFTYESAGWSARHGRVLTSSASSMGHLSLRITVAWKGEAF